VQDVRLIYQLTPDNSGIWLHENECPCSSI
jgi:hypothetical protein